MTRIVHVVRSAAFAGVESFIARLAVAQAAAGARVGVIGGDPARMPRCLGASAWHVPATSVVAVVRALVSLAEPPDVLNVHMTAAEVATTLALPLARWDRPPAVVATCHFAIPRASGSRLARPVVAAAARRRLDAQIAVSRFVADAVGEPAHVVYAGVDEREGPRRRRSRIVLVAQRLEREKHTEDALRIFAAAGIARAGWRLQLAGDGSAREGLVRLAAELGIAADTEVLGRRDDIDRLMDAAGILVAPTRREGLGLAVLEAMAGGLPVLAVGSGGHLETVGSVNGGRLYTDLAHGSRLLVELTEDESGRAAYGAALQAAQRERFTLERQVADTAAVYRLVREGGR